MIGDVDFVANLSQNGQCYWYNTFTHQILSSPNPTGVNYTDFVTAMNTIEQRHGKSGSDRMWVAGLQEVYDYLRLKSEVPVIYSWSGNQLNITLDLNYLPRNLRFYNLSLVVDANAPISSVWGTGYTSMSFNGAGQGEKVINLEMERTGSGLPTHYYKTANQIGSNDDITFIVRDRDGNASQPYTYTITDLCSSSAFLPIDEEQSADELTDSLKDAPRIFPRQDGIYLEQPWLETTTCTLSIFNAIGTMVYQGVLTKDQGVHRITDALNLTEGIYCYRINSPNATEYAQAWSGKFFWRY
jgi:hypothetical protein